MVTRRDMGVSFAPAKRAAVWPRPSREPGRWPMPAPLPLPPGRRTADLPLLAFPACLSTLETKPWPRFFGALGRMRKSSSRRLVMAGLPASSGMSGRAKHVDMTASARASRPKRHGGKAAPCRATPTCRQAFDAARCRVLLSCLPHLPPASAPGNRGPVALLHQQPARRRTRIRPQAGRVRGKTPARWTAAPETARSAVRMHPHRSEEHTSELQSPCNLVCRLLLEKKKHLPEHWILRQDDVVRQPHAVHSRYQVPLPTPQVRRADHAEHGPAAAD